MIKTLSKITRAALMLGTGAQVGYAAENLSNPFPKGAFVRYSTEESIGKFNLSSENNMVNQAPFEVTGNAKDIKSMYLDHWDERDCIPNQTANYIRRMLPELEEFTVSCPAAQHISFERFRSEKLKTMYVQTEAENLDESLLDLRESLPNLETVGIHSNQLGIIGISYVSLLEKLRTFTCSTYRRTLHKTALNPLADMESLERVNYGSWENTGGYTVLMDLYKERQKTGLPPLTLGDTRSDHVYNFTGCKIPLGPNFTLLLPANPNINTEIE